MALSNAELEKIRKSAEQAVMQKRVAQAVAQKRAEQNRRREESVVASSAAPVEVSTAPELSFTEKQKRHRDAANLLQQMTSADPATEVQKTEIRAQKAETEYREYLQSAERAQKQAEFDRENRKNTLSPMNSVPGAYAAASQKPEEMPADEKEKELEAVAGYYRTQANSTKDEETTRRNMEEFNSWPEEDRTALERYIIESNQEKYNVNADNPMINARSNAAELFRKYGDKKVREIAESYTRIENEKLARDVEQAAREGAGSSVAGAIGHSALSVGANAVGAVTGPAEYINELLSRTGQYSALDPNNIGGIFNTYSGAVRSQVAQDIEGEGGALRKGLSYGYQGIMGAADTLARVTLGGGSKVATLGLAASGSFGQTMSQASAQGATPAQAVAQATANAFIEVGTEYLPLDNLLKTAKGGAQGAKAAIRNALKQGGMEIIEEEASFLGSLAAEAAILREKSGYQQQIGELVANGMSYQQAKEQADRAMWQQALDTAIVSGISGGVSSAGASVAAGMNGPAEVKPDTRTPEQRRNDAIGNVIADQMRKRGLLQQKDIQPPTYEALAAKGDIPVVDVGRNAEGKTYAQLKKDVMDKAEQQKWYDTPSVNKDTGMPVFLTRQSFTHAFSNLTSQFGTDTILAMGKVQKLIENAVLTHVDPPKNPRKAENRVFTLFAAINGENGVEPVKIKVKEYLVNNDNMIPQKIQEYFNRAKAADRYNTLYDLKALEVISIEGAKKEFDASASVAESMKLPGAKGTSNSTIKVADLLGLVKGNAAKYIPTAAVGQNDQTSTQPADIPEQSTEGGQSEMEHGAVGAAEAGFSNKAAYQDLLYDGNVQPDRADDARPMEVPKTDAYGRRVTEFAANAYGAAATPDRMVDEIESLIRDGNLGFDTWSNRASLEAARDSIYGTETRKGKGEAATRADITKSVLARQVKDGDIEKAILLYAKYANRKSQTSQENAAELLVDLAAMANMTGRNLQMFKLLRRLTPEGQLMTVQKTVQRNVEQMQKQGDVKKDYAPEPIDPELEQQYMEAARENQNADTPEKRKEAERKLKDAESAILAASAAKMPATFKAKWDTWRYMSMLGNVKTQVRNVGGNVLFVPYKAAKDGIAAAAERVFLKKDQRTKSILNPMAKADRDLLSWAAADAKSESVKDALQYSAKLGDDVSKSKIQENMKVFETEALEKYRKFVKKVPQAGDMLFKNPYYSISLAGFLKARGYTAVDIQSGAVTEATMSEARSHAINEAMKATFNDCNSFSDFFANLRYNGDNPFGKALNVLGEGVLPFRRTPANIVVRFTEYSPVGMAKGVWDAATKLRSGDMSAATVVDELAAGLTGTGAMVLGYFLASGALGLKLAGGGLDEDEERQGHQKYALEFSYKGQEYSYKIDWAAPANLPLFVGANIYESIHGNGGDESLSAFTSFLYNVRNMFEPMLALSCLSSLNDLFETARYAGEGEALYSVAAQVATSYLTQGIPALARQTAQAFQKNKQQTFANSSDPLIRDIQRTVAAIPGVGALFQTDAVNEWGETESRGNRFTRTFNAYINPGTAKTIDNSALEQEIMRLNETQPESVTPPETAKTISYTDVDGNRHANRRLTEKEYNTLATVQGQTAKTILEELVASKDYGALTDAQKAKIFDYVYDYAREKGRAAAISGYPEATNGWGEDVENNGGAGFVNKVVSSSLSDAFSSLTEDWKTGEDDADAVAELKAAAEVFDSMSGATKSEIREDAEGRIKYFLTAKAKGIDTETFAGLYKTYYDISQTNGYPSEKAKTWTYELERAKEAGKITASQRDALKDSMQFFQMMPAETEKLDQMTETGISSRKAYDTDRIIANLKKLPGYETVRPVQKYEAVANAGLSEKETDLAMKVYMPDYDPKDKSSDKTELKYDTIRDMGFSAKEYVAALYAYQEEKAEGGAGTKQRIIRRFQKEFDVSYGTASTLYSIYYGSYFKD